MKELNRRSALKFSLFGCAMLLAGCSGSEYAAAEAPAPAPTPNPSPTPPPAQTWGLGLPVFYAGSGATFDLSNTLPSGVAKGGTFAVSSGGAALPAGMTLSPAGILSVGNATAAQVQGVIFAYTPPGG